MSAPLPKGFSIYTAAAGIRKPGRKDIALIVAETPASAAGVFTTNRIQAAPVKLCRSRIKAGTIRAIVINSGNANACTGKAGLEDARLTAAVAEKALGLRSGEALVSSTGVIGERLPMDRLVRGVLDAALSPKGTIEDLAAAIMTTDTFAKIASRRLKIDGKTVTVTGVAKGAGMIAPNMATMLAYLLTDAAIASKQTDTILRRAVGLSFNRMTVDGDRSTNDTAILMASGAAGNGPLKPDTPDFERLQKAVTAVAYDLARLIVKDGEGATKVVEVQVSGAKSEADAEKAALAIANSLLVKTAIYGRDANWGRIVCAAGYSGALVKEEKVELLLNGVKIVSKGLATGRDAEATKALQNDEIVIRLGLGLGRAEAKVLTCDLTEKYIDINAAYRT